MSSKELIEQFRLCQAWNDPDQWDHLARCFLWAGFPLNAAECFRRADALRECSFAEAFPVEVVA
jgi:hypothetical protein